MEIIDEIRSHFSMKHAVIYLFAILSIVFCPRLRAQEDLNSRNIYKYTDKKVPANLLNIVSLHMDNEPINLALEKIAEQEELRISYDYDLLPKGKRVTIHEENIYVLEAIVKLLNNTNMGLVITKSGNLALVPHLGKSSGGFSNNSEITGVVTDTLSGDILPGANVFLSGTNFGAATDRYGEFVIENVPPGSYTLRVGYIGYEPYSLEISVQRDEALQIEVSLEQTAIEMEGIVVSGLRQGQIKALNQQRAAREIKNVLSREEMEKFPDVNTAEVLQRVPGVSIMRSLGEGAFVYVRGTEPRLTGITVDGQKLPSSEDEVRTTNLGIINANQLASIEVTKALTPDMDANGIGGQVNLVTKSAFDYDRPTLKLDLGGGYSAQGGEPLYRASGSYVGFLGEDRRFGYTLSANFYRNNIDARESNASWAIVRDVNKNVINADSDSLHLNNYDLNYRRSLRDRYGLSGVLEYRLKEGHSFYLRGMYNLRKEELTLYNHYYRLEDGVWFDENAVQYSRMDYTMINEVNNTNLTAAAFGGKHALGGLNLNYDIYYSYGEQDRPDRIRSEWAINRRVGYLVDISNPDYPQFTITDPDKSQDYIHDPANYRVDSQEWKNTNSNNTNLSGLLNVQGAYGLFGIPAEFKAGLKYNLDNKIRNKMSAGVLPEENPNAVKFTWAGAERPLMTDVASDEKITDYLGRYTFSPFIDNEKARAFLRKWEYQDPGMEFDEGGYGGSSGSDQIGGYYDNTERVFAFYLMTTFNIGRFSVLAGVRDELTHTQYLGNNLLWTVSGGLSKVEVDTTITNYNNIFPYFHIKYKLSPMTNIRTAVTQTIARPNFYDLAPYYMLEEKDRTLVEGNPQLEPSLSTNLDLMFEHYFQGVGVASVGLFYKDIDKLIYQRKWFQQGGEFDGFERRKPVNAGSSQLWGFELNWQQQFSFLPGLLNGFGIYANYTKTESKADLEFRDWTVIPGQAGDVGNLGLSYEKYGLTLRLSANFHSPILVDAGDQPKYDRYSDTYRRLDFSGVYELFRNVSLYLNVMNITDEHDREYMGISRRPVKVEFYGISMDGGLKFTL